MTYTSSNDSYAFFVVGGNASGTETGRVYLAERTGSYPSYTYGLFDSGQNATDYLKWTHGSWTSETMIVLGNSLGAVGTSVFNATLADMVAAGIGGSVLYDKVTIL